MTKVLIDTNIFIYDLDKKSKYNSKAKEILNSDFELYTSAKNISEFVSVA